jgi:hypothetical protein
MQCAPLISAGFIFHPVLLKGEREREREREKRSQRLGKGATDGSG